MLTCEKNYVKIDRENYFFIEKIHIFQEEFDSLDVIKSRNIYTCVKMLG